MKTFFVLSLPRSRTAWLANLFTYENSYCFHEGLLDVPSPHHLKKLFERTGKPIVGNSDCGNIFFTDELMDMFPDATFVVVKRDVDRVLNELREMGSFFGEVDHVLHADMLLRQFTRHHDCLTVDFDNLDKKTCARLWRECVGTPFDDRRWEMLDGLDIQIIINKKIEQMREREQNILSMMEGRN